MGDRIALYVQMPKCTHPCPVCKKETSKVHDNRIQKINHLKWFERLTILFYKRRRYVCHCGKRFAEKLPFVDKYQRYSKEGNQVVNIRAIKAKTLKEAAEVLGTSTTTVIRRFKKVAHKQLVEGVCLPKAIAMDE